MNYRVGGITQNHNCPTSTWKPPDCFLSVRAESVQNRKGNVRAATVNCAEQRYLCPNVKRLSGIRQRHSTPTNSPSLVGWNQRGYLYEANLRGLQLHRRPGNSDAIFGIECGLYLCNNFGAAVEDDSAISDSRYTDCRCIDY